MIYTHPNHQKIALISLEEHFFLQFNIQPLQVKYQCGTDCWEWQHKDYTYIRWDLQHTPILLASHVEVAKYKPTDNCINQTPMVSIPLLKRAIARLIHTSMLSYYRRVAKPPSSFSLHLYYSFLPHSRLICTIERRASL